MNKRNYKTIWLTAFAFFYFSFYFSVSYPTRKTFLVEGKYDNGISYMYAPNLKIIR